MYIRTITEIHVWQTPWAELPPYAAQQLSNEERLAYQEGAEYFKRAANTLNEPVLVSLFNRLENDHPMRVYIETENDGPPLVWFAFTYGGNLVHHPQFRLATEKQLPITVPERLDRLYGVFGGFRYNANDCGGLIPPENVVALNSMIGKPIANPNIETTDFYTFLSYGNSDFVCVSSAGDCIVFDHERSTVGEFDLNAALDGFLDGMLEEQDFDKLFGIT